MFSKYLNKFYRESQKSKKQYSVLKDIVHAAKKSFCETNMNMTGYSIAIVKPIFGFCSKSCNKLLTIVVFV